MAAPPHVVRLARLSGHLRPGAPGAAAAATTSGAGGSSVLPSGPYRPGLLTQGEQADRPAPLASLLHGSPTHFQTFDWICMESNGSYT
jgi:hypothetical protein